MYKGSDRKVGLNTNVIGRSPSPTRPISLLYKQIELLSKVNSTGLLSHPLS